MKKYGASLDPSALKSSIEGAANLGNIKNLSGDTKKKFESALQLLQGGGGLASKAKNFMGSVF